MDLFDNLQFVWDIRESDTVLAHRGSSVEFFRIPVFPRHLFWPKVPSPSLGRLMRCLLTEYSNFLVFFSHTSLSARISGSLLSLIPL
jgi:hypothetical protein